MDAILSKTLGQDISKLAAEEKHLLLARLLAHLAHEIRNPLSSLDIHVQLLAEDLDRLVPSNPDVVTDRLEVIRGEIHRLESVVQHFISLANPHPLSLNPIDPLPVLEHVCHLLRPEAEARGVQLEVRSTGKLPQVLADPVRLTQALLNLIINALQAVDRGGHVDLDAVCESVGRVVISVSDDGPGIPKEKRSAIFEPFFTTKPGGGGLGLWIVQQIVLAHRASISVGSSARGGAMITINFPPIANEACG